MQENPAFKNVQLKNLKMKKLFVIFAVAFIAITMATSCQKTDDILSTDEIVSYIDGEYVAQEADAMMYKSAPTALQRRFTYLIGENQGGAAPAGNIYSPYKLLDGSLFIAQTEPWLFWSNTAHNPETFGLTNVYSNLSPTVQSRMVCEVLNAQGKVSHLGIVDFLPSSDLFPLTIINKRVGAKILVNKDDVANIPNVPLQSIEIKASMAPVDVLATIKTSKATVTPLGDDPSDNPNTNGWPNFVYGATAVQTFNVNLGSTGDILLYNEVEENIVPGTQIDVIVKIADVTITEHVSAPAVGYGIKIIIETDKEGWYDSQLMNPTEEDLAITVTTVKIE